MSSGLNNPEDVAVDGSGNVYFSDTGNNAIKKWTAATNSVSTLVNNGLVYPVGVAVDGAGNVYAATFGPGSSFGDSMVYEWNAANSNLTTFPSSQFELAQGVAVDGSGNVYVADESTIREWIVAEGNWTQRIPGAAARASARPPTS